MRKFTLNAFIFPKTKQACVRVGSGIWTQEGIKSLKLPL